MVMCLPLACACSIAANLNVFAWFDICLFQWPRPYIKDVIAYCKKHGLVKILGQQENAANSGQHIELLLLYP